MPRTFRVGGSLLMAWLVAACGDHASPLEPAPGSPPTIITQPDGAPNLSRQQERHQRLARRLALALRDDGFRGELHGAFLRSREREGKLHLQRLLASEGGRGRRWLASLAGEAESAIAADLEASRPIEIYLPVPGHRRQWQGSANYLVATAERDHDVPVAFDARGERRLLDPELPPAVPVIALGTAETGFTAEAPELGSCITCDEDPDGGVTSGGTGGGTGGGGYPVAGSGGNLYLTYAAFDGTFEGWLKGDPEFEIHLLGQDEGGNALRTYQCTGEQAGGPYTWDLNETSWSGAALLFSEAQFDAYAARHPGQALRILVLEDDDTPCVIKTDSARVDRTLKQLVTTFGTLLGGRKDSLFSVKTFTKAISVFNLARTAWSFITTQDDLVGYAIEDAVVREYWGAANWIVKGENTVTHGALKLEMR